MERCPTCILQDKRYNKHNHEITDIHLAAIYQW